MMCYDYHGKWDYMTGHNAPLHHRPGEEDKKTVDHSIQYLIQRGARPEKTVMGVPFYGRTFILKDSESTAPGAPTTNTGFQVMH